jgi:hypothetical protein
MHVKRSKELDDNLPTKNDKKDALVIARLLKDGRFSYPRSYLLGFALMPFLKGQQVLVYRLQSVPFY